MQSFNEFLEASIAQPIDKAKVFDEILDIDGTIEVAGIKFNPSRILFELGPIAYNCGMHDYFDSCDEYTEFEGEYYNTHEFEAAKEEYVAELKDYIEEIESIS